MPLLALLGAAPLFPQSAAAAPCAVPPAVPRWLARGGELLGLVDLGPVREGERLKADTGVAPADMGSLPETLCAGASSLEGCRVDLGDPLCAGASSQVVRCRAGLGDPLCAGASSQVAVRRCPGLGSILPDLRLEGPNLQR